MTCQEAIEFVRSEFGQELLSSIQEEKAGKKTGRTDRMSRISEQVKELGRYCVELRKHGGIFNNKLSDEIHSAIDTINTLSARLQEASKEVEESDSREAAAIFCNIHLSEKTAEEKKSAIKTVLATGNHDKMTKQEILNALDWLCEWVDAQERENALEKQPAMVTSAVESAIEQIKKESVYMEDDRAERGFLDFSGSWVRTEDVIEILKDTLEADIAIQPLTR